jgi:hypothetical protein
MNQTLLYRSIRNALLVHFPKRSLPSRHCEDVMCAELPEDDTPPPPGGPQFPMLLITGARSIGIDELVPYELEEEGIAAEPGTSFSLSDINFAGSVQVDAAAYVSDLMFLPGLDNNESPHNSGVLAFTFSQNGVVRIPGQMLFDLSESNITLPPAVATEDDGTVYAIATSVGTYEVGAGRVTGGVFSDVGARLNEPDPGNGVPQIAKVLDGQFCAVLSDLNAGLNRFKLLAFAFDGSTWTKEAELLLPEAYSAWRVTNGALIGVRSAGTREIDVFGYTAAGGFELQWTLAPATLSPEYQQSESWTMDSATGFLWVANVNGAFSQAALYVLEFDFAQQQFNTIASIEGLTIQFAYALAIHGDVVFADDADFSGVVNAHVRNGNVLGPALSNGLSSFDSLFVLPLA